jgi:hypothetical protein
LVNSKKNHTGDGQVKNFIFTTTKKVKNFYDTILLGTPRFRQKDMPIDRQSITISHAGDIVADFTVGLFLIRPGFFINSSLPLVVSETNYSVFHKIAIEVGDYALGFDKFIMHFVISIDIVVEK